MPSPFHLYQYQPGERVTLKKPHPCGGYVWIVVRTGAEITLRCETCGRQIVLARQVLEKRTKKVEKPADNQEQKDDTK
ncbi:MAG: DUF951 domain-containing protein [Saccharofermentanales bacterium]|jgi:hypothetical protein